MDSLGDRIKKYEQVSNNTLLRRTPVFIRVDGKAFHTFTRGCEKPFDDIIISCMTSATIHTSREMQGFKLAYTQSDEATFMLMDTDSLETEPWFGNNVNKLVSITASMFTHYFSERYRYWFGEPCKAFFDARAFNVPEDDWPNVFIWRQKDWARNSLQMLARAHFSHKHLQGKKSRDIHEMLHHKGVNWADLDDVYKNGTFIRPEGGELHDKMSYDMLKALI